MLYKFKTKAAGDVVMLQANGDELLRIIGREPEPKGILEVADMPSALAALLAAVQRAEAVAEGTPAAGERGTVSLRQRVWPFAEQIRRSMAAGVVIVWGV